MGCSESKPSNQVSVASAKVKLAESVNKINESVILKDTMGSSASSSRSASTTGSASPNEKTVGIPSSLDQVPVSDLGESLDARRPMQLWKSKPPEFSGTANGRPILEKTNIRGGSSAKSDESSDSGIYELEEDYSFVVTEASPAELVAKVERDFTPVENIDLTVTGMACPRLLSGTQRIRQQENEILENLRQEGFISTSKERSAGGLSFEIVETMDPSSAGSGKIKPKDFLPKVYEKHMKERRSKHSARPDMRRKQALAEERRQMCLETKAAKAIEVAGANNLNKKLEELKVKKEQKSDAAMEKREAHLKDLRDKLKAKNKKIQQVKLKKLVNSAPCPVPDSFVRQSTFDDDDDGDFFNS